MSSAMKIAGASKARMRRGGHYQSNRAEMQHTQTVPHDEGDKGTRKMLPEGTLMLQTPIFTLVFVPRSDKRGE